MKYCEDCGCAVYGGRCVNCHEELYILDQYSDEDIPLPDKSGEFMAKIAEQTAAINKQNEPQFIKH